MIHNQIQIISVAEYRFIDSKHCIPYWVDTVRGI